MSQIRLSKYLSECGAASRRNAEELILSGKVKINNRIVSEASAKLDPETDEVRLRGKVLRPPKKGIVLFHKPRSVLSTLEDPSGRRTIADYLPREEKAFFPVGRLDWDSSGLVILTNDGEIANRLMHPRYGFERVYHARVRGKVTEKTLRRLARGVKLEDGIARAKAVVVGEDQKSSWLEVSVREGRNRLVRRIMEKVFHPVIKLKRISHGPFRLGKIKVGDLQRLSEQDYQRYREAVLAGKAKEAKRTQTARPGGERQHGPRKQISGASQRQRSRSRART